MRRGQEQREEGAAGLTKRELLEASGLSAKTFDSIRKAARVRGPGHGGLDWLFSDADIIALVQRAESGQWSERGAPAAAAWRGLLRERGVEVPKKT